jgi:hypothetical protein
MAARPGTRQPPPGRACRPAQAASSRRDVSDRIRAGSLCKHLGEPRHRLRAGSNISVSAAPVRVADASECPWVRRRVQHQLTHGVELSERARARDRGRERRAGRQPASVLTRITPGPPATRRSLRARWETTWLIRWQPGADSGERFARASPPRVSAGGVAPAPASLRAGLVAQLVLVLLVADRAAHAERGSAIGQQILGSGSPASMSTRPGAAKGMSQQDQCRGSGRTGDRDGVRADRVERLAASAVVSRFGATIATQLAPLAT